jgi:hypothetical protein
MEEKDSSITRATLMDEDIHAARLMLSTLLAFFLFGLVEDYLQVVTHQSVLVTQRKDTANWKARIPLVETLLLKSCTSIFLLVARLQSARVLFSAQSRTR